MPRFKNKWRVTIIADYGSLGRVEYISNKRWITKLGAEKEARRLSRDTIYLVKISTGRIVTDTYSDGSRI